jgi:hypothetical protein
MTRRLATDGPVDAGIAGGFPVPSSARFAYPPGQGIAARAVACPAGRQGPAGSGRTSVSLPCPAARPQLDGHPARRQPPDKSCRTKSTVGIGPHRRRLTLSDGEGQVERTPSRRYGASTGRPSLLSYRTEQDDLGPTHRTAVAMLRVQSRRSGQHAGTRPDHARWSALIRALRANTRRYERIWGHALYVAVAVHNAALCSFICP